METNSSKHFEIARLLRAEIAAGKFGQEGRLPSDAQLVKRFKVSRPTVARALQTLQKEGMVDRRAGSGSFVRPAAPGASGPADSRLLGLLIPGLESTEIFQLICGELASLARVHQFSLIWGGSSRGPSAHESGLEQTAQLCQQFIERKVSGVFFAPCELHPSHEAANRNIAVSLREAGIPVVLLDRDLVPFPGRSDFDLVGIDNVAGGYLLADHLIRLGCRRLHFVARPGSAPTVEGRIAGVREALSRHRLPLEEGWCHTGDPADLKFVRKLAAGRSADCFICANDDTAALLKRSLEALRLRVPLDVRVVGFDDAKHATLVTPALTTIHQPCREIALTAFRALLERIADPTLPARSIALTPRLVVRESCGAYLPRLGTVG